MVCREVEGEGSEGYAGRGGGGGRVGEKGLDGLAGLVAATTSRETRCDYDYFLLVDFVQPGCLDYLERRVDCYDYDGGRYSYANSD